MNTIKSIIDKASKKIGYIEANILMQYILNVDKSYLIINSNKVISDEQNKIISDIILKVQNGYPIQYITHKQEFMGLNFYVDENVLIPQPDTEILVEETQKIIDKKKKELCILDLCTGSGAIAISIAKYASQNNIKTKIIASDISKDALEVAKKNYDNIILKNKPKEVTIDFIESDMFRNIEGTFDIIVSNPPYIKTCKIKTLDKDVQNEPHLALDGGKDGLTFYKIIKDNMHKFLQEDGILLMEIGYDQKEDLFNIFKGANCIKDLGGNNRVMIVKHNT